MDTKYNCIYVRGSIPGHDTCIVRVKDSHHNPIFEKQPPPFPTYIPKDSEEQLPQILVADEAFYNNKKTPIKPHELVKLLK